MSGQTHQQNPDGSWSEAEALPPQPGYDVEIDGHYRWTLFLDCHKHIACGQTRTLVGAHLRALAARWHSQRHVRRSERLVRRTSCREGLPDRREYRSLR